MPDSNLTLTVEERDYLIRHLEMALKNERLEEHRTEARAFREAVQHEIAIVEGLLGKVRRLS